MIPNSLRLLGPYASAEKPTVEIGWQRKSLFKGRFFAVGTVGAPGHGSGLLRSSGRNKLVQEVDDIIEDDTAPAGGTYGSCPGAMANRKADKPAPLYKFGPSDACVFINCACT